MQNSRAVFITFRTNTVVWHNDDYFIPDTTATTKTTDKRVRTLLCLRRVISHSNNRVMTGAQPKVSYMLPERYVSLLAVSSLKPKYPGTPPPQRVTHERDTAAIP